jgi:NTP pyrophosphatase (non-canonical NTP hydrolase)
MKTPERTASSTDFAQLSTYEEWATQNWLHTPGTDSAQLHARAKLDEEAVELADALDIGNIEDIISEAGDVLWTATASGSNTGISVSHALSEAYPTMFEKDSITTRSIDELAATIFEGVSVEQAQKLLKQYASTIGKNAKQWFRLKATVNSIPQNFSDAWIATKRTEAVSSLADITLLTSYVLQEFTDSNLNAAMKDNYQKIEQRIKSGSAVTRSPRI